MTRPRSTGRPGRAGDRRRRLYRQLHRPPSARRRAIGPWSTTTSIPAIAGRRQEPSWSWATSPTGPGSRRCWPSAASTPWSTAPPTSGSASRCASRRATTPTTPPTRSGCSTCAPGTGCRPVVFSSTAAVYGQPDLPLIDESQPLAPINPYGASKMMSERVLVDIAAATGLRYAILRYFNVAGADAEARIGEATPDNAHLIKLACETALGLRPGMAIHGTDYPTPDGTCIRDYVHVDDLARAHLLALEHLADGGASLVANCGYGHGFSVREVLETARRVDRGRVPDRRRARAGPAIPPVLVADSRRLQSAARLGAAPRRSRLHRRHRLALGAALQAERRGAPADPASPRLPGRRMSRKAGAVRVHAAGREGAQTVRAATIGAGRCSGLVPASRPGAGAGAGRAGGPRTVRTRAADGRATTLLPAPAMRNRGPSGRSAGADRHPRKRPGARRAAGEAEGAEATPRRLPSRAGLSRAVPWIRWTPPSPSGSTSWARRWSAWPARCGRCPCCSAGSGSQLTDPFSRAHVVLDRQPDRRLRCWPASSPAWSCGPCCAAGATGGASCPRRPGARRGCRASLAHLAVNLAALATFLAVTYVVLGYTGGLAPGPARRRRHPARDRLRAGGDRPEQGLSGARERAPAPRPHGRRRGDARPSAGWRCCSALAFYGYFGLAAARRLGLPWTVHGFLMHAPVLPRGRAGDPGDLPAARLSRCRDRALGRGLRAGPRPVSALARVLRRRPPRARGVGGAGLPGLGRRHARAARFC